MIDDNYTANLHDFEREARAARQRIDDLQDELEAARVDLGDKVRAYYSAAIGQISGKEQAERVGIGESTHRAMIRPIALERRAARRAARS
ncbi:hypothetical protein [Kineococcus rhizosphaerae]|uniref:Uncharacterized protein n=1 Tax=Kineococcus rhizosphaerae TaxID=559628 RepID=A0A2T0QTL2_9ACTN|nr:hypothetical protein [Kineococcus rhizosphaerae]PRY08417.1 hypothetical protein CLV37_12412 [Kineococcus rhizosphaerae]